MTAGDSLSPASRVVSPLSRGVALALALVGGVFGLHRFYVGRRGSGVAMILTVGGLGIWWLYDVVMLAAGDFRDAAGRLLRRWPVDGEPGGVAGGELADRLDQLEREVMELAERLDFAERLLAQRSTRDRLPPA